MVEKRIEDDALVPIKVRGSAYRLIKTVAAWRGVGMSDYLTDLIMKTGQEDLKAVLAEITANISKKPTK
jgi:hypothetical protein